jgi:hypothetical protein
MFDRFLKKINPEHNPVTRAMLYVIGCGGLVHLITLLTLAIIKKNAVFFNPLYTIDVDQIWPAARHNPFVYTLGWVGFFLTIYVVYRTLRKRK